MGMCWIEAIFSWSIKFEILQHTTTMDHEKWFCTVPRYRNVLQVEKEAVEVANFSLRLAV